MPWLRARFERIEGGKTAIQEVIKLYAFDFPRDSIYLPLESFQGIYWRCKLAFWAKVSKSSEFRRTIKSRLECAEQKQLGL